jgi:integrase
MAGSMRLVGQPDTWELRVYVGRDKQGRVRHRHARVQGSQRAAERALARMVAEVDAAGPRIDDVQGTGRWGPKTTINDAIAAWRLNDWEDLSPSTTRRYESIWSVHVRGGIGRTPIVSLSSYDLERYYRKLKADGLAEATVRQTRALLNRACRLARKWSGNSLPNPVADSELPTWSVADSADVRAPTLEEVNAVLAAAHDYDPRVGAFTRLLAATGMRRGEACAIRRSDVDLEARTVRIDESIVAAPGGASVKPPKTRASIRTVALDGETVLLMGEVMAQQDRVAAVCNASCSPASFVFSFEPGGETPPYPDFYSHEFAKVRKRAGVPADLHLHSLRHFQATLLDAVVTERQKQARLGWATVHMARHYTGAIDEEDRRAAEHVGRSLAGARRPQVGQ